MDHHDLPRPGSRGSALGMMLSALGLAFFLMVLIFISGGFFFYVVLITACVFAVSLLHYAVWGRAMSRSVAGEREEELLRQRAEGEDDGPAPDHPHGIRRP
jgi:hypothetical protein